MSASPKTHLSCRAAPGERGKKTPHFEIPVVDATAAVGSEGGPTSGWSRCAVKELMRGSVGAQAAFGAWLSAGSRPSPCCLIWTSPSFSREPFFRAAKPQPTKRGRRSHLGSERDLLKGTRGGSRAFFHSAGRRRWTHTEGWAWAWACVETKW